MNNTALNYENTSLPLEQRHIAPGSRSIKIQTDSKSEVHTNQQQSQQQAIWLKNKLMLLNKDHEELYRQFATAHTESEVVKTRLSIYEKALRQILSTTDLEKVMLIADTKSAQQREHTIAMHKWSDLL
jgi:hypothetical protein